MTCCIRKAILVCVSVFLVFGAAPVAATGSKVTYTCDLNSNQSKTWIPQILFIGHDTAQDRVVVSDPIILYFNDRIPVEGRVSKETAKRITFAWDYIAQDNKGDRAKMQFQATWMKPSRKITVQAHPAGYSKRFHGKGTCEIKSL